MTKETFKLPSGREVTLCESNAEFEAILTRESFRLENSHIKNYIAALSGVNVEIIKKWPIADIYTAFVYSRIMNYGPELIFKWKFSEDKTDAPPTEFIENLNIFVNGGSKAARNYPLGDKLTRTVVTESGKIYRYSILTGEGEDLIVQKERGDISLLDIFKSRFLEQNIGTAEQEDWIILENYKVVSIKDSKELRADIMKYDPVFDLTIDIKSADGKYRESIALLNIPDFLVPSGI